MSAQRQWIQAASIRVAADGAILVGETPPSSFAGGSKVPAEAGVAEPLVSVPTPCRFVWVGVPIAPPEGEDVTSWARNTSPVLLGDQASQNLPLTPHTFRGVVIHIADASLIYVRSHTPGDGVEYRISGPGAS